MKGVGKIERIKTGIPGLDEMVEGGIPKGFSLLIAGSEGTCKTIMATQMAYHHAKEGGSSLYVSLENRFQPFLQQTAEFGWDVRKLEEEDRFHVLRPDYRVKKVNFKSLIDAIKQMRCKNNVDLLVLDSLTKIMNVCYYPIEEEDEKGKVREVGERDLTRRDVAELVLTLKGTEHEELTTIIVDEADNSGVKDTLSGFAEYDCDGVILLNLLSKLDSRTLSVKKMRATKIKTTKPVQFTIGKNGITVEKSK